ncbi:DNA polymerase IV [Marivirga sp. S37H4]|uniref:DNA polymerase IV n=1 Tax=Marivirga aurantiaca TaxID=2802615 RepID=A0A934X2S6_9BACT|nr:DNA polymerase IV [Marivirga aurantiaca]
MIRKIIHVDMDAFFASVEQMDNPALRGKAVAVGGNRERGVVAAASYEARKFGVFSAMPSKIAAAKCKDLIFVKPRFERYKELSHQIREIFYSHTDLVEPLSLDEAYLDVTQNKQGIETATEIALDIKETIKREIGLTASAGISINKFLAKIASDYRKPDGIFIIKPHQVEKFIEALQVKKFFGVGKVTAEKMHKMGIFHGKDLKRYSLPEMLSYFGKQGKYYYEICRGIDNRAVNPNRIRKSVGAENTFSESVFTKSEIIEKMLLIVSTCWKRYDQTNAKAHTISIKVKFDDFTQITRSKTIPLAVETETVFKDIVLQLIDELTVIQKIRLLGCSLSNFEWEERKVEVEQLTLGF